MGKFDPWPVFFRREWNRTWPFLVGFAITGTIITKFSLGLTEEDAKNSPFVQRHRKPLHSFTSFFLFRILLVVIKNDIDFIPSVVADALLFGPVYSKPKGARMSAFS